MTRIFQFKISSADAGQTVNEFLRSHSFSHHIVADLKRTAGAILLQRDAPVFPGQTRSVHMAQADSQTSSWISVPVSVRLMEGDLLKITLSDSGTSKNVTPVKAALNILYEDEDILVIDKPADMPVHPSINNHDNTLANAVVWYYQQQGSDFVFRCINRLDRDTSGAVVIAKNALASSILSSDMKQRRIHRTYLAIVKGHVPEPGTVDAPIARMENSVLMRCVDPERGEPAITHYAPLQYKNNPDLTLLRLRLDTGRTHQIRVHMNDLGFPLIGDYLYHPDRSLIGRQALHSHSLAFRHPVSGEELRFVCPMPADMCALFQVPPDRPPVSDASAIS